MHSVKLACLACFFLCEYYNSLTDFFFVFLLTKIFVSRVRFHYGHPDIFDRLFHLTRGGVSKASKIINLSEDIFAGMPLFPPASHYCLISMEIILLIYLLLDDRI